MEMSDYGKTYKKSNGVSTTSGSIPVEDPTSPETPTPKAFEELLQINNTQTRRLAELSLVRAALDEERTARRHLEEHVNTLADLLDQFLTMYPTSAFSGKSPASQMLIEVRERVRKLRTPR